MEPLLSENDFDKSIEKQILDARKKAELYNQNLQLSREQELLAMKRLEEERLKWNHELDKKSLIINELERELETTVDTLGQERINTSRYYTSAEQNSVSNKSFYPNNASMEPILSSTLKQPAVLTDEEIEKDFRRILNRPAVYPSQPATSTKIEDYTSIQKLASGGEASANIWNELLNQYKDQLTKLKQENLALLHEKQSLQRSNQDLHTDVISLQESREQYRIALQDAEGKLQFRTSQVKELEEDNLQKQRLIEELSLDRSHNQNMISSLQEELAKSQQESFEHIQRLEQRVGELSADSLVSELQRSLEIKTKEAEVLGQRLVEVEEKYSQELVETKQIINSLSLRLKTLSSAVSSQQAPPPPPSSTFVDSPPLSSSMRKELVASSSAAPLPPASTFVDSPPFSSSMRKELVQSSSLQPPAMSSTFLDSPPYSSSMRKELQPAGASQQVPAMSSTFIDSPPFSSSMRKDLAHPPSAAPAQSLVLSRAELAQQETMQRLEKINSMLRETPLENSPTPIIVPEINYATVKRPPPLSDAQLDGVDYLTSQSMSLNSPQRTRDSQPAGSQGQLLSPKAAQILNNLETKLKSTASPSRRLSKEKEKEKEVAAAAPTSVVKGSDETAEESLEKRTRQSIQTTQEKELAEHLSAVKASDLLPPRRPSHHYRDLDEQAREEEEDEEDDRRPARKVQAPKVSIKRTPSRDDKNRTPSHPTGHHSSAVKKTPQRTPATKASPLPTPVTKAATPRPVPPSSSASKGQADAKVKAKAAASSSSATKKLSPPAEPAEGKGYSAVLSRSFDRHQEDAEIVVRPELEQHLKASGLVKPKEIEREKEKGKDKDKDKKGSKTLAKAKEATSHPIRHPSPKPVEREELRKAATPTAKTRPPARPAHPAEPHKNHPQATSAAVVRKSLDSLNESRDINVGDEEEEDKDKDEGSSVNGEHRAAGRKKSRGKVTKPKVASSLLKPTRSSGRRLEEFLEDHAPLKRSASAEPKTLKRSNSAPPR